jgi:reactive intermediate/imine deaminase
MSRQIIQTSNAPAALGPYSQAVRHGDLVFLSGQVALDPVTGQLVGGGIDAQTRQVFRNLQAVCEAAGGSLEGVLKLNIFLTDLGNRRSVRLAAGRRSGDGSRSWSLNCAS